MSLTKEISVELRTKEAKKETERQRKAGFIPGILYGHGDTQYMVSVKKNEFIKLMHQMGSSSLLDLKSDNKDLNGVTTIIKDLQYHPVKDDIIHIDFQAIKKGEEIKLSVAFNFVGESAGVKEGGMLQIKNEEMNISCKPKDIPTEITIDISALEIGDAIRMKDVKLPNGVKLQDNEDTMIVSVLVPKEMDTELNLEGAVDGTESVAETTGEVATSETAPEATETKTEE